MSMGSDDLDAEDRYQALLKTESEEKLIRECRTTFRRYCLWQGDKGSRKRLSAPHHDLMDMARWIKLCKDSKLIDGEKLTRAGAEIVFAKVGRVPSTPNSPPVRTVSPP
jgi:hypothetical protein